MKNFEFDEKEGKNPFKMKFDNSLRVSYPNQTYEFLRKWSYRKGISMQDFQRKAVEFYIQHLEMDNMELQNFKNR
jgi:hypothetical protein